MCLTESEKHTNNLKIFWNSCIKASVSNNLSENPGLLELFFIIFDNKFWEIFVAETNRFAYQAMHDERKKQKVDDTWYPVTLDEMKAYYALCILIA